MKTATVKSIILTVVLALMLGSGALAATSGEIPFISEGFFSDESVGDDAYHDNHGSDVSAVARDKDAIGTWTNPAGKVIENHGQAVREAAHDKEHGNQGNPPEHSSAGGNPPDHGSAGGNGPGSDEVEEPDDDRSGGDAAAGNSNGQGRGNGAGNR